MSRADLHIELDAANDQLRKVQREHRDAEREFGVITLRLRNAEAERDRVWQKLMRSLENGSVKLTEHHPSDHQ